ncbi:hypothetical protein O3P69_002229 [Scylla paramamosain]|uniref:TMEM248/TMEM219 domain-containing protein n=1 Tax=Scylla paramamosain TaxID=85552 RepID=A0AAW0V6L5_SCYPA
MAVCSNARECVGNRPPLVVFTASIAVFAVALVGVSLYLQSHKTHILNPDIKDWNSFFTTLSGMEICFPNKDTQPGSAHIMKREVLESEDPATTTSLPETNSTDVENNVTLSVLADVHVEKAGVTLFGVNLHSSLPARHLGFNRDPSALEMTISLVPKSAKNWTACIMMSGPAHLLPDSPIRPVNCSVHQSPEPPVEVELAKPWLVQESFGWCSNGVSGNLLVAPQHELSVYLSEGDVTLIQIHILYTTCLLFVMMLFLLFYLGCGKRWIFRSKIVVQSPDKVPLHP